MTPAPLAAGDGVTFPLADGARATTPTGQAILGDAARPVRPDLAERIAAASAWRSDYLTFVHELTAASGVSPAASLAIAEAGLASMRGRMVVERDGVDLPLADGLEQAPSGAFSSRTIEGTAAPMRELRIPYRGRDLHGEALGRELDRWVGAGLVEPSLALAVRRVMEHPEWLRLEGRRVAVVGAASEMGPLEPLTAWGADVLALDLPDSGATERIARLARAGAGRVTVPVAGDGTSGADLLRALPEVRAWIRDAAGDRELVLGMYAYADGGLHVRLSAAFDALATDLLEERPGTALAYLATPTDAFVVPEEVVVAARAAWDERGALRRAQAPVRALARGRLFVPAYAADDGVADILVEQQGPNYALAKRLQRWRAVSAAVKGHTVSANVAPAAWTRSVTRNRVLAAAYRGAHRFGVEIFHPETCRVLMAALLVHDLHHSPAPDRHPELLLAEGAAHGGLWRSAYEPRSVLGLAALMGIVGSRRAERAR